MPSPTYEELAAENAALKARLEQPATRPFPTPPAEPLPYPFVREQAGTRQDSSTAPHKTNQIPGTAPPLGPTPQQLATVRGVILGGVKSTDPVVIQGQIDAITTVIASGVNSAGYGDKRTEFRSLSELREILNGLREDLAGLLGYGGRIRQIRMTTQADKGL